MAAQVTEKPQTPTKAARDREVAAQVTEKPQNVGASDVLLGVQSQIEVDTAAVRRDDQGAEGGDLFVTPLLPDGEGRRDAARRPSAAQERGHPKARFVQAD